jgi:two-component system, OmpR family, phosphate regulon sensor histidine kinase PhoR
MPDALLYLFIAAAAGLAGYRLAAAITTRRWRDRAARAGAEALQLSRRLQVMETERARMTAILSGMVEGVLVVDGEGRLQLANDAARRMLNLEDHLLGRHYVEAVRQPGVVGQLSAALKGEDRPPIEVPLEAASRAAGPRIFRAQATPASAAGGGAVLVLHDISDLRRVDRVRRDFVANVSHELRTPLTAVRGYVEALMDGPVESDERRKFLEVIDRHTGRMERLVTELLRLARLDAQQETADLHAVDVAALFRLVVTDLSDRIERRQVQVSISVDPAAATMEADPTKMHDALRNLIENAVNYSGEGGRIELEAHADGDRLLLSVSDYGPGVPEADLGRVFERFYRVDKSRSSDPGGTGLGLSIVRHLVELHGGRITAGNRAEGGAVFTISLPRKRHR